MFGINLLSIISILWMGPSENCLWMTPSENYGWSLVKMIDDPKCQLWMVPRENYGWALEIMDDS